MSVATPAVRRDFPLRRRHTLVFLRDARSTAHVHLAAELDASALQADRERRRTAGTPVSFVSYVVKAAGDVLADYPDARSVLTGWWRPRLSAAPDIEAKVLYDRWVDGQRCVLAGVVPAGPDQSLDAVQRAVAEFRDDPLEPDGRFADVLRLHRLPVPVIGLLYRALMAHPGRRLRRQGAFSVTSVGHEPVRSILPLITGTVGLGVGRVAPTPVVRDGEVVVAPVLHLSLTFDHRVIDGAMAAEILGRLTQRLERWTAR